MGTPLFTGDVFQWARFCNDERLSGKKRTLLYISREEALIFTSKHGTTIFFFSHYNLFQGKLKEKLARKACVNTERVDRIVVMPPGHLIILLKFD